MPPPEVVKVTGGLDARLAEESNAGFDLSFDSGFGAVDADSDSFWVFVTC